MTSSHTTSISNRNEGKCHENLPFSGVPIEVLANIFAYLNKDGKKVCRLVSWRWKKVLDEHLLIFHGALNDATYDYIRSSSLHFTTLTANAFNRTILQCGGEAKSLSRSKLALSPDNLIFGYGSLQNSSVCTVSEQNMAILLSLNRNVKSLRFRLNSLKNLRSLSIRGLHMNNLTKLEMAFTREIIFENQIFHQLAEIGMPSLSHLIFHVTKFIIFEQDKSGMFYISLFQFVSRHKASLTSLEIRNDYYLFFPLLSNTRHHVLPVSDQMLGSLISNLSQVQLTEFSYLFKKPECSAPYTLGFDMMESQRQLQRIKIEERNDSSVLIAGIERTIDRNCMTLAHFTWRCCRYSESMSYVGLKDDVMVLLSRCLNLQSLCLHGFKIVSFSHFPVSFSTMKSLELEGDLNPRILHQITTIFSQLEKLRFYNLTPLNKDCYRELAINLRSVMTMPHLKIITWYIHGLYLHYAPSTPDICVKRGKQGKHYYVITFKK